MDTPQMFHSGLAREPHYAVGRLLTRLQGKRDDDERLQTIAQAIPFFDRPLMA